MVHAPKTGFAGYVILEGPQYVGGHSEDLQILRFINPHHYHCDHHHHHHRHRHRHRQLQRHRHRISTLLYLMPLRLEHRQCEHKDIRGGGWGSQSTKVLSSGEVYCSFTLL